MTPDNAAQAQLLFNLILLVTTVGNSILIFRKLSGKAELREIGPSPLTVQAAPVYATRAELAALEKSYEAIRDELREETLETRRRIDNLPDRIIAILRNTGAIQ